MSTLLFTASTGRLRAFERHRGFEPGPGANGRANRERTADRLQPLAHAEQPETGVAIGVDVESHALIGDDEVRARLMRRPVPPKPRAPRCV